MRYCQLKFCNWNDFKQVCTNVCLSKILWLTEIHLFYSRCFKLCNTSQYLHEFLHHITSILHLDSNKVSRKFTSNKTKLVECNPLCYPWVLSDLSISVRKVYFYTSMNFKKYLFLKNQKLTCALKKKIQNFDWMKNIQLATSFKYWVGGKILSYFDPNKKYNVSHRKNFTFFLSFCFFKFLCIHSYQFYIYNLFNAYLHFNNIYFDF